MNEELMIDLNQAIEVHSKETAQHVERVAKMSYILAKAYGLSEIESRQLESIAPMHDIGKLNISELILQKPDKLTKDEYEEVKKHTIFGYELLKHLNENSLEKASILSLQHHEHWDGTGYPNQIKEYEIDIFARITSVVDVFDALVSPRSYKEAWGIEETMKYIKEQKGSMFEPKLVDVLESNIEEIITVYK